MEALQRPDFEAKRDRIVELYALAGAGEAVVICLDEFGPLTLQPQPGGRGWAPRAKPKRIRATYTRRYGMRWTVMSVRLLLGRSLVTRRPVRPSNAPVPRRWSP